MAKQYELKDYGMSDKDIQLRIEKLFKASKYGKTIFYELGKNLNKINNNVKDE